MIPIHNHSHFSALDGFSTPEEIADRCVEIGCSCCGLTDHGVVTGHLAFTKALEQRGLKTLLGCEFYHGLKTRHAPNERDQAHLIGVAVTSEGLKNLWRLVNCTAQKDHFHNVGRVFWHDLEKYHEGIVFTSACAIGLVAKGLIQEEPDHEALNRYLDIFGDNFFLELHTYPADHPFRDRDSDISFNTRFLNERLVAVGQERGIPMVYSDDAHRARPDQYWVHDAYIAIQTKQTIYTPPDERSMWHPSDALVIHSEEEVREALDYLPKSVVDEAIANSDWIGEMADVTLPEIRSHLPVFIPKDCPWLEQDAKALSPEDLFIELVEQGIVRRYGEDASQEVWERTIYEVETLIRDGIHHYFLMGWDEIMFAKDAGIPTSPGRGSSAGCVVAYALGITDVDPLHYGLIFERFWNSGRAKGFPDIDSDFSRSRRDEVIAYLKRRWGEDRVCAIGTTGFMKPKSTIDKLAKGCAITFEEAKQLKEIVGKTTKIEILGHEQIGWTHELEPGKKYYVEDDVGNEIERWITAVPDRCELRRKFVDLCKVCCSRVQQYGIHASGIVIGDVPLADELPAYRRGGKEGVPATMFTMEDVDARQFIKLDVLGLRTLDVIDFWEQFMAEYEVKMDWSGLDKEKHPDEMWDMLRDGYTAGIFQVEDGYGRQLCKRMEPRSVEDLAVIVALNRPGPIQAGIPDRYIARRKGEEPVTYIHPKFKKLVGEILTPTHALWVYQEQIIAYFNVLGYTLSESDAMRKIMGKKKPELLDAIRDGTGEWENRGYLDMAEAKGLPCDVALKIWEELEGFGDYSFNFSHAVSYAIISFRTLFIKYYAAAQAYAASICTLEHSRDGKKRQTMIPEFINECRRLNIPVRPPDIRYARDHAYVDPHGRLLFGFGDIQNVGNSGNYMVELRDQLGLRINTPEAFLEDFERLNLEFAALKKQGVEDGDWDRSTKSPRQILNAKKIEAITKAGAWDDLGVRDITLTERQQNELEMLGVVLTDNTEEVLDTHAEEISTCDPFEDLLVPFNEKPIDTGEEYEFLEYRVCGIVANVQEKRTRNGDKPFASVTIERGPYTVTFTVFSNKWKSHRFLFKLRSVGIFTLHHRPAGDYPEGYIFNAGKILR